MARIETSVVIKRPIEEVFAFVTDIEKFPQWTTELVEVKETSDGSVGVGTTFIGVVKLLGRRMENTHEVTEYEPPTKIGVKTTSGPVSVKSGEIFEAAGENQTKVTVHGEAEVGSVFHLAEPIVERMAQRQWEAGLENLKDVLEV